MNFKVIVNALKNKGSNIALHQNMDDDICTVLERIM
jgi:hypothetical protein